MLIAIGGASLTLSLTRVIGSTPVRVARREPNRLADIVELVPS